MVQVERARILLEKALARQRGVSLDAVDPIIVDAAKNAGLGNYVADLNYRAINQALRKQSAEEWDDVYADWKKGFSGPKNWNKPSGEKDFGENVLRSAIQAERDLTLNPSPYSDELFSAKALPKNLVGLEPEYQHFIPTSGGQGDLFYELIAPVSFGKNTRYGIKHITNPLSFDADVLTRGMHFDRAGFEAFKKGLESGQITDGGFSSFSLNPFTSQSFMNRSKRGEDFGAYIKVVPDNSGRAVDYPYWGFNPEESEFLFLPGTEFEVVNVKDWKAAKKDKAELFDGYRSANPQKSLYAPEPKEIATDKEVLVEVVPRPPSLSYSETKQQKLQEALELIKQRDQVRSNLQAQFRQQLGIDGELHPERVQQRVRQTITKNSPALPSGLDFSPFF